MASHYGNDGLSRAARRSLFLALALFVGALLPTSAYAESTGNIAQGYPVDTNKGDIVAGSLVSLKSGSRSVELATTQTAEQLVGVTDQNPLVAISDSSSQAQVVLNGTVTALVSDINGEIKAGDKITASPIAGVGMRASSDTRIVGSAQSNLDTNKSDTRTVSDAAGAQHTVHIGYVSIQLGLAHYTAPNGSFLPAFIQNLANNVAGKDVSIIRIIFVALLLLFSIVGLGVLISSTVRSAITSLGRNPLAAPNIRKSLYQVGGIALAVLAGTLLACYLILVL